MVLLGVKSMSQTGRPDAVIDGECMQMVAECICKGAQGDGNRMCSVAVEMLVDSNGFKWKGIERTLRVQNTLRGDISSADSYWR
jgi:hypothetical protein